MSAGDTVPCCGGGSVIDKTYTVIWKLIMTSSDSWLKIALMEAFFIGYSWLGDPSWLVNIAGFHERKKSLGDSQKTTPTSTSG